MKKIKFVQSFKGQTKTYTWQSLLIATLVVGCFMVGTTLFPDFIAHKDGVQIHQSYLMFLINIINGSITTSTGTFQEVAPIGLRVGATWFVVNWFISIIFTFLTTFVFARLTINWMTFKPWFKKHLQYSAEIINATNKNKMNDRVALIIATCNDLSPKTALQTANQTYNNVDVWLLDDSSKPESIKAVKEFANKNGFFVCRRPDEHRQQHPSVIGNIYYFLSQYGKDYDYLLETNSSSILTNTFVENGLAVFNSPKLKGHKVGAVCGCGCFYHTKSLFSWIIGVSSQCAQANGDGLKLTGHLIALQGWGGLYKTDVLLSIPLEKIECPGCDTARGFYLAQLGYETFQIPYDFSGKITVQNIYRFALQKYKWAGADAFILKTYFLKRAQINRAQFFITTQYFIGLFAFIIGFVTNVTSVAILGACPQLSVDYSTNYTAILIALAGGVVLGMICLISFIVYRPNLKIGVAMALSSLFDMAILLKKMPRFLWTNLIRGKWSAKAVTIKSAEKLTAKDWFKISKWDLIWFFSITLILTLLTVFCPDKINVGWLWGGFYSLTVMPSILWIILSFIPLIPVKSGWDNNMDWFDIAGNDFRFKYVKDTQFWKELHKDGKW
ncbi:MAG: hypothetical protein ACOQNY_00405 [Mycoplasmoidaceae bacterium]